MAVFVHPPGNLPPHKYWRGDKIFHFQLCFTFLENCSLFIMMWYSRGDWELKNTCCKHKMAVAYTNLPWIPGSPLTVQCRELSKRVLLQTFQEDSTRLNRPRGKQWSVIQRTSKICDRHARHRWGKYNVPCTQAFGWKEKLAVLMLPRFQESLQRTRTLILKPGKRLTWIYRNTLRRRVC